MGRNQVHVASYDMNYHQDGTDMGPAQSQHPLNTIPIAAGRAHTGSDATYLTTQQAAEHLQRHEEHIQELMAFGVLPYVRAPWNGPLVPVSQLPPYSRPSEED